MRNERGICGRLLLPQPISTGSIMCSDAILGSCLDGLVSDLTRVAKTAHSHDNRAHNTQDTCACCDPGGFDNRLHVERICD